MSEADWCPTPISPPTAGSPGSTALPEVQPAFRQSTLCARGWQPLFLTGFLRDFLVDQWSKPVNIFNPDLQQFVWSNSPESAILIESATRFQPENVGQRPAIIIKRNRFKISQQGLGGQQQGIVPTPTERGAFTQYTSAVTGSHTIFCVNWSGAMAEVLSTEVLLQLMEFSGPIRKQLFLHQYEVLEVGALHKLRESTDSYAVPITVGWTYEAVWQLKLQSLPLKTVQLVSDLG